LKVMGLEIGVIIAALSSLFGFSRLIGAKTKMEQSRGAAQQSGVVAPPVVARSPLSSAGLATVGMLGAAATGVILLSRRTKNTGKSGSQTTKKVLADAVQNTLAAPKKIPAFLFRVSRGRLGSAPQPRRSWVDRLLRRK
jgi:hypothetical protein